MCYTQPAMETLPAAVGARWSCLATGRAARFGTGLINDTFRVEGPSGVFLAQRLHPAFGPAVHDVLERMNAEVEKRKTGAPSELLDLLIAYKHSDMFRLGKPRPGFKLPVMK